MALTVGDPVPNITMPGPNGERVELGARQRSGFVQVIGFADGACAAAMAAGLRAHSHRFAAIDAVVSMAAPGEAWSNIPAGDLPIAMAEQDFQLARHLGAAPPCIWIMDPGKRLARTIPWDDSAAAVAAAAAEALFGATSDEILELPPPVLVIPQVFEPDFCAQLIDYWHANEKQADMVATSDFRGGGQAAEAQLKRRLDTPITDVDLTRQIAERLARRVGPQIGKAFQTVANHFETFRIGRYDAADNGHFGRHWDDTAPKTAHRKLAMSVNLNTGDFEGGALTFPEFGRQRLLPPTGAAVIFSCKLLHEAMPVTKGHRFGLFGFFYDDQGAEIVRQWIEAEGGRVLAHSAT